MRELLGFAQKDFPTFHIAVKNAMTVKSSGMRLTLVQIPVSTLLADAITFDVPPLSSVRLPSVNTAEVKNMPMMPAKAGRMAHSVSFCNSPIRTMTSRRTITAR